MSQPICYLRLKETLDSGWINTGPRELEFRDLLKQRFKGEIRNCLYEWHCGVKLGSHSYWGWPGDEVISTPIPG